MSGCSRIQQDSTVADSELQSVVSQLERETVLWQSFLRAHRAIRERLTDHMAAYGLPLEWFDVLIHLAQVPEMRLRQSELRNQVLLSESGVSRMLARMSKAGLVSRTQATDDRRSMFIVITDRGKDALLQVTQSHVELVASLFSDRLSVEQSEQLRSILALLTDDGPVDSPS